MSQRFTYNIPLLSRPPAESYTFSAKEKDSETGLSYFGSRYYSSDLSVWLSVDPMSDKYPSLSPYTYCADNPVKLVDPDGEEVWIIGDDATAVTKAFEQLQSSTSYILKLGDNGKVEIIGGKAEYDDDRLLAKAINDNTIRVNVTAINGNSDDNVLGGAFMGNKVSTVKPSFILPKPFQIIQGIAARCVNTYQTVDPFELEILDNIGVNSDGTKAWPGQCMLHEVTESYCGGILAYKSGISAGNALKSPFAYNIAHNAATAQPDFDAEDKWQLNEMVRQIRKK